MKNIRFIIEFIWNKFELFIRRTVLPSSVFITLLLFVDYNSNDSALFQHITNLCNNKLSITIITLLILLLAINYILKFLTQFLFDNFIKINYDALFCCKKESAEFKKLRTKVCEKLVKKNVVDLELIDNNDFMMYQVLGNVLESTNVKRYVTDAKEAGVMIVSILLVLSWYIYLKDDAIWLVAIFILYFIGIEYIRGKYRSRAYRMYVNYLIENKNKEEGY